MTPTVQTFDNRQQVILADPSEITPGDWLPDLGTLRQVESVDTIGVKIGPGVLYILHFVPQPGIRTMARGYSGGTKNITVWRELHESDQATNSSHVSAVRFAEPPAPRTCHSAIAAWSSP